MCDHKLQQCLQKPHSLVVQGFLAALWGQNRPTVHRVDGTTLRQQPIVVKHTLSQLVVVPVALVDAHWFRRPVPSGVASPLRPVRRVVLRLLVLLRRKTRHQTGKHLVDVLRCIITECLVPENKVTAKKKCFVVTILLLFVYKLILLPNGLSTKLPTVARVQ